MRGVAPQRTGERYRQELREFALRQGLFFGGEGFETIQCAIDDFRHVVKDPRAANEAG